jgi:hypothetical protein
VPFGQEQDDVVTHADAPARVLPAQAQEAVALAPPQGDTPIHGSASAVVDRRTYQQIGRNRFF